MRLKDQPFKSYPKSAVKPKTCDECSRPLWSRGKCKHHAQIRDTKARIEKNKEKNEADLKLMKEIWNERKHECSNCKQPIYQFNKWNFHHKELKSKRPDLRYDKENIEILCLICHSNHHS